MRLSPVSLARTHPYPENHEFKHVISGESVGTRSTLNRFMLYGNTAWRYWYKRSLGNSPTDLRRQVLQDDSRRHRNRRAGARPCFLERSSLPTDLVYTCTQIFVPFDHLELHRKHFKMLYLVQVQMQARSARRIQTREFYHFFGPDACKRSARRRGVSTSDLR